MKQIILCNILFLFFLCLISKAFELIIFIETLSENQ